MINKYSVNMTRWEVTFPIVGNFDLDGDFEIAEVTFSKNAVRKENEARIIIEAENRDIAKKEAKEKIENKLDAIAFVRGIGLEMGNPFVFQLDSEEVVQFTRELAVPRIDKTHQRIIKKVYGNIEPCFRNPPEEIEKAILALRWYREGCFFDNPVDSFLAFWIALESLTGEKHKSKRDMPFDVEDCIRCVKEKVREDNNLRSQIIQSIHEAYRPIPDVIAENIQVDTGDDIKTKIRRMHNDRSDIVHHGKVQINRINKHNIYLKNLLEKILKDKLNTAFNNFIDSWPLPELLESLRDDYLEIESIKQVLSQYSEGATLDDIRYGLYPLRRKLIRPKDLEIKIEVLIKSGDLTKRITNNKEFYFLNS